MKKKTKKEEFECTAAAMGKKRSEIDTKKAKIKRICEGEFFGGTDRNGDW